MTVRSRPIPFAGVLVMAVLGLAAAPFDNIKGNSAMPLPPRSEPLSWQGAADRAPTRFVALRVTSIKPDGGGLFGVRNSPSLVGALPDPRIIAGTPIGVGGGAIKARVPGAEVPPGLAAGSRVVLGLVDADHVICLLMPPDDIKDEALETWAEARRCG